MSLDVDAKKIPNILLSDPSAGFPDEMPNENPGRLNEQTNKQTNKLTD